MLALVLVCALKSDSMQFLLIYNMLNLQWCLWNGLKVLNGKGLIDNELLFSYISKVMSHRGICIICVIADYLLLNS